MPNCTGNCSSASISSGTGFIFRGGDTWHFGNSALTPYVGSGGWNWTHGGSSTSSPIYLGVDPGWYTGGSWVRPVLNGDNPLLASTGNPPNSPTIASCTYSYGAANNMITFGGLNNWWFDNFEITGYCWNTVAANGANYMFKMNGASSPNNDYFVRNYIHGWTRALPGRQADATQVGSSATNGPGWHFWFNVSDGSDSDWYATGLWGGASDGSDLAYNVVRYQGATNVLNSCQYVHDNLFEYIQNTTDGSTHTDVVFCYGTDAGSPTQPLIFWNNVFRHIGTLNSQSLSYVLQVDVNSGVTAYHFNNVAFDNYSGGNHIFDQHDNGCEPCAGSYVYFNNTFSTITVAGGESAFFGNDNGINTPATTVSINNHFISTAGTQGSVWQSTSNVTESSSMYMTASTAAAQGYAASNNYAPQSATAGTVTAAGTNDTSIFCTSLNNSFAATACEQGITGISYNVTNHTVSWPGVAPVARPSTGNWNAGAYEFASSVGSPQAPSGLVATVE
jgi:hypothetical protein